MSLLRVWRPVLRRNWLGEAKKKVACAFDIPCVSTYLLDQDTSYSKTHSQCFFPSSLAAL
jgi:hypothetical protein